MNTGIDAKRIFFNNSGLGNYGRRYLQALTGHFPDDSFLLYSPKPVPEDNPYLAEAVSGRSRIVTPGAGLQRLFGGAAWRSAFLAGRLERDAVGIYYGLSNELPYGIHRLKIKKVVVIHDLIFIRYPELYPAIDVRIYRAKTRYACRHADRIVAVSGQTRDDIRDFYGVDESRISVIYPPGHPYFYADSCSDSTGFFRPSRPYLLSIGAITPRKNLMKTVEAFARVSRDLDLDLVVVGTAVGLGRRYLASIKDFVEEQGLTDRIHFLGNVPLHLLPDICRKAEMLIYPSQFEGFGMPIVEGLFSGIPVITSRGGCFPEAGGDAAAYIDPENAGEIALKIVEILHSESLRAGMTAKGRLHARRFTRERISADIAALHLDILQ
jgi:glycosyltransferase involved in cell wall biosynthesis